jgi:hypothetical protein
MDDRRDPAKRSHADYRETGIAFVVLVFGQGAEIASAADDPEIGTAPAVKIPKGRLMPMIRAPTAPNRLKVTAAITITNGVGPSFMITEI